MTKTTGPVKKDTDLRTKFSFSSFIMFRPDFAARSSTSCEVSPTSLLVLRRSSETGLERACLRGPLLNRVSRFLFGAEGVDDC